MKAGALERREVATLPTESIASPQPPTSGSDAQVCPACGSPLAAGQRYCLECGERQSHHSEFLSSGAPLGSSPPSSPPQTPPAAGGAAPGGPRSNTVSLLAGVGVLLLAMGVGVLIGRSGGSAKPSAAPVQVVTQGGGTAGTGAAEASFTNDWPSGRNGYTVQLQTLPASGTTIVAVQAAKTSASGKGATNVGALKSEDFATLEGENYVIYSGVYHKQAEAQKALGSLKKKFPGAKVIHVSETAGGAGGGSAHGAKNGAKGSTPQNPAPPSALEGLSHAKGKSYVEKSKNLPDVVSTG